MNKQRQILVTVTYNDLGCIIDTKAEPYEEPNLQPTCNQIATDCISRQAAIDAVYDAFCYAYCDNCEKNLDEDLCGDCHRKYQNWSASKKTIEKVINALPSAQPERKMGEWVWSDDDASWKCGSCDCVFEEFDWRPEYNFCPNCGADMRGEEHEDK